MIVFPVTAEEFIADQERIIGRALSENEKAVTVAWLENIHCSYEGGLAGDIEALEWTLSKIDELIIKHYENQAIQTFLCGARKWIIEAWRQGAEKGKRAGE